MQIVAVEDLREFPTWTQSSYARVMDNDGSVEKDSMDMTLCVIGVMC